ncbi:type II toxin-antitoxin system prevent-host-death family antitoxin [Streptomyces sp. ME01-24h]|nr:type II toxin-antitoxin system prevent-host-death family antitoxin [Streptomyces sp. ME01-24h]
MSPRTEHRAKIAEARNVLGEVISRARFAGEPTILINRGKEAAVIVPFELYEEAKLDRARIEAIEHYLLGLASYEQTPEVVMQQRMARELLEMADRRAKDDLGLDDD